MDLTRCMHEVENLVDSKGYGNTLEVFPLKLLFAHMEIDEAAKKWRDFVIDETLAIEIGEELIDVIFFILDAYSILKKQFPQLMSPSAMFCKKLSIDWNRPEMLKSDKWKGFRDWSILLDLIKFKGV